MLSSYILLSRVHITHNFIGSKYEDARGEISGYLLDNIVVFFVMRYVKGLWRLEWTNTHG